MRSFSLNIEPQYIAYGKTILDNKPLHPVQELFFNIDEMADVQIIEAPTGTGKSFAFALPLKARMLEQKQTQDPTIMLRKELIISPTNALIEDMKKQYNKNFSDVKTEIINSTMLNELQVHGIERWKTIEKTIYNNDLLITNPDLLNFAIMSGYFTGKREPIEILLEKISFFIFDEYHLYDEEQIANILAFLLLAQKLIGEPRKFIFVSATPEAGLQRFLENAQIPFRVFSQEIQNTGENARQIHGKIKTEFIANNICDYLYAEYHKLKDYVNKKERVLIIFDSLAELHRMKPLLKQWLPDINIAEESGYMTKAEYKDDTGESTKIILATNKVEVGVNLDVNICLMQPGKYFQNFLQRFGRVARGNYDGEVLIFVDKIKKIEKAFSTQQEIDYTSFIEKYRDFAEDRSFYEEKIPSYLGAFLFAIRNFTKNWALKSDIYGSIVTPLEGQSKSMHDVFYGVQKKINKLREINSECADAFSFDCKKWENWWNCFLKTFHYFRGSTIQVEVQDLDYGENWKTIHSLEWILKNKNIIRIEEANKKKKYVVSGMREDKQPFGYVVSTIPLNEAILLQNEKYDVRKRFLSEITELSNRYQQEGSPFSQHCYNLCKELKRLAIIFSWKRITIEDIIVCNNII